MEYTHVRQGSQPVLFEVVTVPSTIRVFLVEQINYLSQRGFDVHAVCACEEARGRLPPDLRATIHKVPLTRSIHIRADLAAILQMVRLFMKWQPVVVHSHTPKGGMLGMIAAWLAGVPVRVYTIHGLAHPIKTGLHKWLHMATTWLSCRLAHRVLCVSPSVRDILVSSGLCGAEKAGIIGQGSICGVDAERFSRTPDVLTAAEKVRRDLGIGPAEPVMGFLGRLTKDKGIIELALSWQSLAKEFSNLHLVLIGQQETEDPLPPEILSVLQQHPRVHMLDWQDDVVPYLTMMTILVLPSYREGFGMVLLEAAALEVATVATRIAGCVDAVVNGKTGLLVEAGNSESLSAACRKILLDKNLRRKMGADARKRAIEVFNPHNIFHDHYAEYLRLMRRRGVALPSRFGSEE